MDEHVHGNGQLYFNDEVYYDSSWCFIEIVLRNNSNI